MAYVSIQRQKGVGAQIGEGLANAADIYIDAKNKEKERELRRAAVEYEKQKNADARSLELVKSDLASGFEPGTTKAALDYSKNSQTINQQPTQVAPTIIAPDINRIPNVGNMSVIGSKEQQLQELQNIPKEQTGVEYLSSPKFEVKYTAKKQAEMERSKKQDELLSGQIEDLKNKKADPFGINQIKTQTKAKQDLEAPQKMQELEMGLRKEVESLPAKKNLDVVFPAFDNLKAGFKQNNGAGDVSGIYNLIKMMDPGSAVKGDEVTLTQSALPGADKIAILYKNLMKGDKLTPETRKQYIQVAKDALTAQKNNFDRSVSPHMETIGAYGIDRKRILGDYDAAVKKALQDDSQDTKTIKGTSYNKVNGKWIKIK